MKEQMNVPKLRFDEFDTQWKPMPLGEITSYLKGFAFKSEDYLSSGHADSRLIRVSDLSSESVKIDNQKVFLPQELMESSTKYKLKDDDVLITTVGSKPELRESAVGRAIYINKAHGYLNQNLLIMRPKGEHLPRFIFSQLNTPRYINHITNIQRGNANQSNITVVDLFEYRVSTTSFPEQQKIASFLSKVDEKIALLTEKKDKITEYKKGVMQQLFNGKWEEQDGQLIFVPPTLRFKADDDSEFPDWEEKKFGDCFDFFTTNSLSRDKLSYDMGMIKNIHYGDIHTKFRSIFKPEQELVPYIAELDDTKKIKPQSYCQNGDLVFADASEDYADIGKCIEVRELGNLKLVAGLHTHLARPKEKFATGYQAYLQKSWKMRYQIMRIAQGTKVLGISTKQLATIYLPVPCYEEQEKIAAFLTSLDSKIECLEFELNKSKEWKKGLLQQMFV
ncbi:TPA: restriction endonuclease subunit S [Vibrio parahaemolyticus]|nr:restriction endonuclease subunit S [Vibrio parahaemolyticus]HCG9775716.1 restriction endonuclease subunit S [Vibrio parahaemolyticus]HCH0233795.1 restriction endonuclease subunit S [Vibrio parahaemolyticus]HCH2109592.1 restriction endonuclease subunit S [Vibrio parahaemolyticus]